METFLESKESKRDFYRKVIKIGTPMALTQLMTSLLSLVDTIMVKNLGDNAVAAVGISVSFMFLLIMVQFGFFSGLAIFVAQFWGSKDIKNMHKVFVITVFIGAILSTFFFLVGHFFPDTIISIYNNGSDLASKAEVLDLGVRYLKIAAFSYFTMTITFTLSMYMRSVERVMYPQIVSISVVVLNTFLNYILIFGNYGFPKMGVEGAAIATLISSFIGSLFLIGYFIKSKSEVFKIKFSVYKEITRDFVKKLLDKSLPVALNEAIWGLGMTAYVIAYGFISPASVASAHITNQIMGLFWAFNAGLSGASAIMLGNKLGEGNLQIAKSWGIRFIKILSIAGILLGVLLFALSDSIAQFFTNISSGGTNEVANNVGLILRIFAFYIPIKFINAYNIIGSLRSGGDTKFALFAEIGPLWIIGVPLAFILSLSTDLPLYIIIAIVNIEEIFKFALLVPRFFTFKWVKNLTN